MSTLPFGHKIHHSDSLGSTQDAARTFVERDGVSAAGVVFSTNYQTAGRGRQGKTWYAPPGANIINTFIGNPILQSELWQASFVAAIAAADAIAATASGVPVHLRFPNDILLNSKKVCGILIETATGPDVPLNTAMPLIGIGINVRGGTNALPPEVAVRATTIETETGKEVSIDAVGASLANALTARWNEWRTRDGFATTLAAWHHYHDIDARRTYIIDGAPTLCRVLRVSADGYAILELPDQSQSTVPVAHVLIGV